MNDNMGHYIPHSITYSMVVESGNSYVTELGQYMTLRVIKLGYMITYSFPTVYVIN